MSKNDNEILDILSESFKKEAENTELPEALSKDNIVAMLKAQQAKEQSDAEAEEKRNNIKPVAAKSEETEENEESKDDTAENNKNIPIRKKSYKKFTGVIAAAAAFAVIVGAGSAVLKNRNTATKSAEPGYEDDYDDEGTEPGAYYDDDARTTVEPVTDVIVDGNGEVIGTEVATDNSGNVLTTIVNVIDAVRDVTENTVTQGTQDSYRYTANAAVPSTSAPASTSGSGMKKSSGINANGIGSVAQESLAGYEYSKDGYYYYPDDDSQVSLNDYYTDASESIGHFTDLVRVNFEYEDKQWLIQLGKGQYGFLLIGAEINVYTCDADEYDPSSNDYSGFVSADKSDQLGMSVSLSYKDAGSEGSSYKKVFATPYDTTWHCNGFVKGQLSKYSAPRTELKALDRITFKSADMAEIFADRLQKLGFTKAESSSALTDDSYAVKGSDVYILWNSIYTGDINGSAATESTAD